jgi:hypothetical protein
MPVARLDRPTGGALGGGSSKTLPPTERTTAMTTAKKIRRMARPYNVIAGEGIAAKPAGARATAADGANIRPTKQSLLLDLLREDGGVSPATLAEATGWLPHTTRAALSGLRKNGHAIVRSKVDGVTHYLLVTGPVE